MEAKIGKSYLTGIPFKGEKIDFQYPAFRGNYGSVAEQIDRDGLKRPNSAETASLVYDSFQNKEGKYESEIIGILNDEHFWEFTGNLDLPKSNDEVNNGVILVDNPNIVNRKLKLDKNSLVERLRNNDEDVRFVPFGFQIGSQKSIKLAKNPYIIARYGEEGAEKIAEISSEYKKDPYLYFESVDEEIARMSALYSDWDFGFRLGVDGDLRYAYDDGHSFGRCTKEPVNE